MTAVALFLAGIAVGLGLGSAYEQHLRKADAERLARFRNHTNGIRGHVDYSRSREWN